jgi:hypothetical protein
MTKTLTIQTTVNASGVLLYVFGPVWSKIGKKTGKPILLFLYSGNLERLLFVEWRQVRVPAGVRYQVIVRGFQALVGLKGRMNGNGIVCDKTTLSKTV